MPNTMASCLISQYSLVACLIRARRCYSYHTAFVLSVYSYGPQSHKASFEFLQSLASSRQELYSRCSCTSGYYSLIRVTRICSRRSSISNLPAVPAIANSEVQAVIHALALPGHPAEVSFRRIAMLPSIVSFQASSSQELFDDRLAGKQMCDYPFRSQLRSSIS